METIQQHEWVMVSFFTDKCIHCNVLLTACYGGAYYYPSDSFYSKIEPPCIIRKTKPDGSTTT